MSEDLKLIKELRDKTGAGFLDCKVSLKDNQNDIEKAVDDLRKKGLAKATKKSSRLANEGAIGVYSSDNFTVIIKINSETDFSAKSGTFLDFIDNLGNLALNTNDANLDVQKFLNLKSNDKNISEMITEMIAKIGEKIILSELKVIEHKNNNVSYYVHNPYRKNVGKIISVIQFNSSSTDDEIIKLSKNICMHIAALKPESIDKDGLSKDLVDKEIKIQKELILSSGKPENVIEKILEGKMNKFYSEITLMNQNFVLDPEKTVKQVIDDFNIKYSFELINFKFFTFN